MLASLGKKFEIHYAELALVLYLFHDKVSSAISWIILGLTGQEVDPLGTPLVAVTAIFILIAFVKCYKRIRIDSLVVIMFFALAYSISYWLYSTNAYQIDCQDLLEATFIECIPVYILFRLSDDYSSIWDYVRIVSWIILIEYAIAFVTYDVGHVYRSFSSGMIIPSMIFIIDWLYRGKTKYSVLAIASIILMTVGGRRSSLAAVVALVLLILLLKKDYKVLIVVLAASIVLFLSADYIIETLYNLSTNLGINSRTLRRLMSGDVLEDSHRFEQWAYVIQLIFDSPERMFFGLGVAGERDYLLAYFAHMELQGYPHGILVEMIGHYGILVGSFIDFFLFFVGPLFAFKSSRNNQARMYVLLIVVTLAVPLLFQDSYLQSKYFFLYLATIVAFAAPTKESQ